MRVNNRAQVSIEYLLVLSAAILLAAVVFAITMQTKDIVYTLQRKIQLYRDRAILSTAT